MDLSCWMEHFFQGRKINKQTYFKPTIYLAVQKWTIFPKNYLSITINSQLTMWKNSCIYIHLKNVFMLGWVPVIIVTVGIDLIPSVGHLLLQIEKWSNRRFAGKNVILWQKKALWLSLKCLICSHFFTRIFSKTF